MVAGTTNAVNLTDGLDGLAAGCAAIVLLAYIGITFITNGQHDLALLCGCLVGACVGFLWFNAFPATIFMGDTGSLGLGGAIAGLAVMTAHRDPAGAARRHLRRRGAERDDPGLRFQTFRKRVFLMAPIHHHFELMAWSETKIILRFWIVAGDLLGDRLHDLPAVRRLMRPEPPPGPYLVVGLARSGRALLRAARATEARGRRPQRSGDDTPRGARRAGAA